MQIFERHSFEKVSFGSKMKNFAVKDLRVRMYFLEKKYGVTMIFCSKNLRDRKIFSNFAAGNK